MVVVTLMAVYPLWKLLRLSRLKKITKVDLFEKRQRMKEESSHRDNSYTSKSHLVIIVGSLLSFRHDFDCFFLFQVLTLE